MTLVSTVRFSNLTVFLLLFSVVGIAQERTLPVNEETALNLSQEWGVSALNNSLVTREVLNNNEPIEALFTVDTMQHLQQKIQSRFQTGLYSLQNNYLLSSHFTSGASHQFFTPNLVQHKLHQFGRFRTETGYSNSDAIHEQNFKAFLHSAYSIVHHGRFELSLTASIESIDAAKHTHYLEPILQAPTITSKNEQATSATLGVMGSFDLSNRWSLVGAVTTSHLTSEKSHALVIEDTTQKMALIGTTYSF